MEKVLIDSFVVPAESRDAFLEASRYAQSVVKVLPGFVEGFVYEQNGGESRHNFLTIVVWESETAFANAKSRVAVEYAKRDFNPQATIQKLNIELVRSTYERFPY